MGVYYAVASVLAKVTDDTSSSTYSSSGGGDESRRFDDILDNPFHV